MIPNRIAFCYNIVANNEKSNQIYLWCVCKNKYTFLWILLVYQSYQTYLQTVLTKDFFSKDFFLWKLSKLNGIWKP